MDERQRFKLGFISRCIEDGFTTPADICQRAKTAADHLENMAPPLEKEGQGFASVLWDAAKSMGTLGISAALVAPPVLGGVAGYGLARAGDIDEEDVEEAKQRELVEELKRQSAKIRRQQRVRSRSKDPTPASLF